MFSSWQLYQQQHTLDSLELLWFHNDVNLTFSLQTGIKSVSTGCNEKNIIRLTARIQEANLQPYCFMNMFAKIHPLRDTGSATDFIFSVSAQYSQTVSVIGTGLKKSFPFTHLLWVLGANFKIKSAFRPCISEGVHFLFIEQYGLNFASSIRGLMFKGLHVSLLVLLHPV